MKLSLIDRIRLLKAGMIYTTMAICIGGPFIYGWNISCMNLPSIYIKKFMNHSLSSRYNVTATPENKWNKANVDWLFSLATLIFPVGGFVGASISGILADRLGRRNAVMATHFFGITAGFFYYSCYYFGSFEVLMAGRFLAGIASGACFAIVPMYGMEIVPTEIRASIATCSQLFITLGNFAAHIFTQDDLLGSETTWSAGMSCMILFSSISLVLLSFPCSIESPRWLLTIQQRPDLARIALRQLYNKADVTEELSEILEEANQTTASSAQGWNVWRLLRNAFRCPTSQNEPSLTWPLIIVVTLNACQQLTGVNVYWFFSKTLYTTAGIPDTKSWTDRAALILSFVNMAATIVAVPLIESFNRRSMLLYPTGLLSMAVVGQMTFSIINTGGVFPTEPGTPLLGILCLVCFALFIIGFAVGLAPIPNFIATELFEDGPRATAQAIGGSVNLFATVVVALLFETVLHKYLGNLSFLPFFIVTIISIVFFALFLPETKDRQPATIYANQRHCPCGTPNGYAAPLERGPALREIVPPESFGSSSELEDVSSELYR